MKHKIIGRYGHSANLEQISEDEWRLEIMETEHCRMAYETNKETGENTTIFVDPPGGPPFHAGVTLDSYHIQAPNRKIASITAFAGEYRILLEPEIEHRVPDWDIVILPTKSGMFLKKSIQHQK